MRSDASKNRFFDPVTDVRLHGRLLLRFDGGPRALGDAACRHGAVGLVFNQISRVTLCDVGGRSSPSLARRRWTHEQVEAVFLGGENGFDRRTDFLTCGVGFRL
jgi:hypothetical protein